MTRTLQLLSLLAAFVFISSAAMAHGTQGTTIPTATTQIAAAPQMDDSASDDESDQQPNVPTEEESEAD